MQWVVLDLHRRWHQADPQVDGEGGDAGEVGAKANDALERNVHIFLKPQKLVHG